MRKFNKNRVGNESNINVVFFTLDNNTLTSSTIISLK